MNVYAALKAHMGDWTYYIVKMRMREVAQEIGFGSQVYEDPTLDDAIQRDILPKRVKTELIPFLSGRSDRFFSSLVVAAVGGSPKFFPVNITDDERFEMLSGSGVEEAFGVLRFDGNQNYYALDGQHRLKAIKSLVNPHEDTAAIESAPADFINEEISVLMVIRPQDVTDDDWLTSYRRLFSALNRYAKPTDHDTNIIMDEDDSIAIITRRLIGGHDFFKAPGRQRDSFRVKTKGRPLKEGTSHFTSLQQLYAMNTTLMSSLWRGNKGWGIDSSGGEITKVKDFIKMRPSEEQLDAFYDELTLYWDALIATVDDLGLEPSNARNHSADGSDGNVADNALFWPIGQDVFAGLARMLLDARLPDPTSPKLDEAKEALAPLAAMDWRLHEPPWRGILLTWDEVRGKWGMRSEDRKQAMEVALSVSRWLLGLDDLTEDDIKSLKFEWIGRRIVPASDDNDQQWDQVAASHQSTATN